MIEICTTITTAGQFGGTWISNVVKASVYINGLAEGIDETPSSSDWRIVLHTRERYDMFSMIKELRKEAWKLD